MAKGAILKKEITDKILEIFPNSFLYNDGKEIRINGKEDGEDLQIKCTLTCSKAIVGQEENNALPGQTISTSNELNFEKEEQEIKVPTQEEKDNVKKLLTELGL